MLAYKAAKSGDTCVLITLEIPSDARTNLNRMNIAKKETAKYRTDKAKVLKIEDEAGKAYTSATTGFYIDKHLTYKVGEVMEEPTFNPVLEEVCTSGIHFFLDKNVAALYYWKIPAFWCGVWSEWHDNGQKYSEIPFILGKIDGVRQYWYENGQKRFEGMWRNGFEVGVHRTWHENGQLHTERIYDYGVVKTESKWDESGVLIHEKVSKEDA